MVYINLATGSTKGRHRQLLYFNINSDYCIAGFLHIYFLLISQVMYSVIKI